MPLKIQPIGEPRLWLVLDEHGAVTSEHETLPAAIAAAANASAEVGQTVYLRRPATEYSVTLAKTPTLPPPSPPPPPGELTLIGATDGSVLGAVQPQTVQSHGPAFGIPGFGRWWEFEPCLPPRVQLVDDPTNPTGSGKAIEINISPSGCGAIATANMFPGSPYRELYVRFRLFRPGWTQADAAHKWFYFGQPGKATGIGYTDTPFVASPHQYRVVGTGQGVLVQGNSVLGFDRWDTVELRFVAESEPFARDGEMLVRVNGQLVGHRTDVTFTREAGQAPGFGAMQWYGHHSNRGRTIQYRIGELYIAGVPG